MGQPCKDCVSGYGPQWDSRANRHTQKLEKNRQKANEKENEKRRRLCHRYSLFSSYQRRLLHLRNCMVYPTMSGTNCIAIQVSSLQYFACRNLPSRPQPKSIDLHGGIAGGCG